MAEDKLTITRDELARIVGDCFDAQRADLARQAREAARMEIYSWATSELKSGLKDRIQHELRQITHTVKIKWED